eukprot:comp16176_c0_seq1/m.13793 comp16176_c0_seq1/g.13793  ORF comp16176_c0_seq1/g.13793 comp16176_c0_seq1/m.13793 type:complete len:273 (-) comp16176_c0_seq1:94-912(-)
MSSPDKLTKRSKAPSSSQTAAPVKSGEARGTTGQGLVLVGMFAASLAVVYGVYATFPAVADEHRSKIKLPRNLDDAKALGAVLEVYQQHHFVPVTVAFFVVYIFLQTFAIPGSIFLSILSGALFPFPMALFLVCLCSAIGATNCYYLSYFFGRDIVHKYFPERLDHWQKQVAHHQSDMANYIVFLRITPFLPNWFINIASPVLNVKVTPFFIGTFIGVGPPTMFFIKAGQTLQQLSHTGEVMSYWSMAGLVALGFVFLLPIVFKQRLAKKLD